MKNCCCCLPLYVGVCIIGLLVFVEAAARAIYFINIEYSGPIIILYVILSFFFVPVAIKPRSRCTRKTLFIAYLIVTAIDIWQFVAGILLFMVVWPVQKEICK